MFNMGGSILPPPTSPPIFICVYVHIYTHIRENKEAVSDYDKSDFLGKKMGPLIANYSGWKSDIEIVWGLGECLSSSTVGLDLPQPLEMSLSCTRFTRFYFLHIHVESL